MSNRYLPICLLLILLLNTACAGKETLPATISPLPTDKWQPGADVLVLRLWQPGRPSGVYARWNLIPQLQIWGDGRVMWLEGESPYYERQVREGVLPAAEMDTLYQKIMTAGFESWEERYDNSAEPLPGTYLAIDPGISQLSPRRVYVEGEVPDQFRALFAYLQTLPAVAQSPRPYQPDSGQLHVHGSGLPLSAGDEPPIWPENGPPLDQEEQATLTGDMLLFTWNLINDYPAGPLTVQYDDQAYMVSLAIPGVSFCSDGIPEVMDFCP